MKDITLSELLKSGAHFGHQKSRWNPKMAPFIFTVRNNIHILDLAKTREKLLAAMNFAKDVASKGGTILFVGTKRQSKDHVRKAAVASGMPYVVTRWLGGTFTNFRTIQKTIKKMERYENLKATGELEKNYTKKERLLIERELVKLKTLFEGIKDLRKLPEAIMVFDINYDEIAVTEARKSKVKIIGVVDTNSDPEGIDYPIPSNDDAIKAIGLVAEAISDAVQDGKKGLAVAMPASSATPAPVQKPHPAEATAPAAEEKPASKKAE
jgi:small subunit ribosomal protein S2